VCFSENAPARAPALAAVRPPLCARIFAGLSRLMFLAYQILAKNPEGVFFEFTNRLQISTKALAAWCGKGVPLPNIA
jgi:hypothetical protein